MSTRPLVIRGSATYPSPSPRPVVTIGNFDGVHLGHRTLLNRASALAAERGVPTCAYTFHPAPRDVLRPDNQIPRIQRLEDRIAWLGAAGMAQVVIEPFTRDFGSNGPEWFATEVLGRRLGASAVVVGWDFRFGKGRAGGVAELRDAIDVPVESLGAYELDGEVVSSSRIRQAIGRGDVAEAARCLGRPHQVVGEVVRGDARGRGLGFPTANVASETPLVPANGVYAVRVTGGGLEADGVANIGVRPTFGGGARQVEVHLLDYEGDLYGRELRIDFVARIREERSFGGVEALVAQIRLDVAEARALLGAA